MRMMLKFTLPVESSNAKNTDGSLGRTMESIQSKFTGSRLLHAARRQARRHPAASRRLGLSRSNPICFVVMDCVRAV